MYTNGTLVIEQAQRQTDAGTYTCQAQNRQKNSARRDVEVQVIGRQITIYFLIQRIYFKNTKNKDLNNFL